MKTSDRTDSVFVDAVAEMQGIDGPFSFSEKLLQKIWLRGDFDAARAATADGRTLRVLHPGKWNLLGGPDFKNARLQIGGREVMGDIELHLYAGDWAVHGHAGDKAYDGVVLHVVLFPSVEKFSRGCNGRQIPVLALLPLLHRGLEEFAADEAVENLAGRRASRVMEELGPLAPVALETLLRRHAEARWRQKVHFARVRVERLGWEAACHHTALEILGYRFNRAPMLRVAAAFPLSKWAAGEGIAEEALAAEHGRWSLQGVRPANHPRVRLRQYTAWTRDRPDWPARLDVIARSWSMAAGGDAKKLTGEFRRVHGLAKLRTHLFREICAGMVGGTRLDNLACDGFWPLLAARGTDGLFDRWFHWLPGDLPPQVVRELRELGIFTGRDRPACHGFAQGLLGWLIADSEYAPRRS